MSRPRHALSQVAAAGVRRAARWLACAALLAPAGAWAQDAWSGRWLLQLDPAGPRVRQHELDMRLVTRTAHGERLTAVALRPGGWALELAITPGAQVGLVGIQGQRAEGGKLVCAGMVRQGGVMEGSCYRGDGTAMAFSLAKATLAAAPPPAPPGPPPAPSMPPVVVPVPSMAPPLPPVPDCGKLLLDRGHHPSHLRHCRGAEPACAAALLSRGHHPSHLKHCTADLTPECTSALLSRGHHPSHLRHCARVDGTCAVRVLITGGHHPTHLRNCR